jgi:hypothetical protein
VATSGILRLSWRSGRSWIDDGWVSVATWNGLDLGVVELGVRSAEVRSDGSKARESLAEFECQ